MGNAGFIQPTVVKEYSIGACLRILGSLLGFLILLAMQDLYHQAWTFLSNRGLLYPFLRAIGAL